MFNAYRLSAPILASLVIACAACSGSNYSRNVSTQQGSSTQRSAARPPTPNSLSNNMGNSTSEGGSEGEPITRQEAIDEHWDDIKGDLSGSEEIEACSAESGNCYNLDADISNGEIEEIHFPNGGHLTFSADIDSTGSASDSDENGNDWDFTIDMNSTLVLNAIEDWANANGYSVQ